jgi:hypothetical protein
MDLEVHSGYMQALDKLVPMMRSVISYNNN